MDDTSDPITRAALEAAKALKIMGWPVLACENGKGEWRIRDAILTHDELVDFAIWAPTSARDVSTDPASPQTHRDPHAPLDNAEAIGCIRAVMGVMIAPTLDDQAAAFRLIQAVIEKSPRAGED